MAADSPGPAPKRLAVRLTPDALRQVRGGHPWVYDASIRSVTAGGAPGDLAVVFDADRKFAAIGLWDPASPIRLKVLHRGRPTTIDAGFWRQRIAAALDRRAPLRDTAGGSDATTAYRCVHGENDGLPGLVVDRYDTTYVLKLYSAAWIPHLRELIKVLEDLLHPRAIVLRLSRAVQSGPTHGYEDGMTIAGTPVTEPVRFQEHGLAFEADVVHGQKTGHFLDQRENRAKVGALAGAKRVLDVFSCTGGFSVYAAAGGATEVHSVDASTGAIDAARRNMAANADRATVAACRHETTVGDAFEVMDRLGRGSQHTTYDIVVVDPPSFASNAAGVPKALTAYAHLARLALRLVRPGGLLVQASCSSRITVDDLARAVNTTAAANGVNVREITRTGHPLDHPIGFPEGAYLKALYLEVRRSAATR